jgi:ribosomal protein S18 acetylase RimI-like enzyme
MSTIKFKFISDENNPKYHLIYVMLCNIFPDMMGYKTFTRYTASIAHINNDHVAFTLLEFDKLLKSMTIVSLGVKEEYRGNKIGKLYINWIKSKYPDHDIYLHVSIRNENAVKLYKSTGFKIIKTQKEYYSDMGYEPYVKNGLDAYYMKYTAISVK